MNTAINNQDEIIELIESFVDIYDDLYKYDKYHTMDGKVTNVVWCNTHNAHFKISPEDHLHGKGCPKCDLEMKYIISEKYGNMYTYDIIISMTSNVAITCNNCGFVFNTTIHDHVNLGKVCPCVGICDDDTQKAKHRSRCEELTRDVIEAMFGVKFKTCNKTLPDRLQLDGYNNDLKLAFEYQGEQHYKVSRQFNVADKDKSYNEMKIRDARKVVECQQLGIKLLVISYTFTTAKDIRDEIIKQLGNYMPYKDIDCDKIEQTMKDIDYSDRRIAKAKEYAESKGGTCLSLVYSKSSDKLTFKCKVAKHEVFETPFSQITRGVNKSKGHWCPECGGTKPKKYEDFVDYVSAIGGTLVEVVHGKVNGGKSRNMITYTPGCNHANITFELANIQKIARDLPVGMGCSICKSLILAENTRLRNEAKRIENRKLIAIQKAAIAAERAERKLGEKK